MSTCTLTCNAGAAHATCAHHKNLCGTLCCLSSFTLHSTHNQPLWYMWKRITGFDHKLAENHLVLGDIIFCACNLFSMHKFWLFLHCSNVNTHPILSLVNCCIYSPHWRRPSWRLKLQQHQPVPSQWLEWVCLRWPSPQMTWKQMMTRLTGCRHGEVYGPIPQQGNQAFHKWPWDKSHWTVQKCQLPAILSLSSLKEMCFTLTAVSFEPP